MTCWNNELIQESLARGRAFYRYATKSILVVASESNSIQLIGHQTEAQTCKEMGKIAAAI
jgi:hypothetical protein